MNHRRALIRGTAFLAGVLALYFALLAGARSPGPRGPTVADHPTFKASRPLLAEMGPSAPSAELRLSGPRVQLVSTDFDFGIVDPYRLHQHEFELLNAGDKPLVLLNQSTADNRLTVDIDPHTVSPGKKAKVRVAWDAQENGDRLAARVSIQTNDPARPTIDFELVGHARIILAAEPPLLEAPQIKPTETTTVETAVVSPEWDAFALEAEASLSGVECNVTPMDPAELQKLNVKSGWRLAVTLPTGLPAGKLREKIYLKARPEPEGPASTETAASSAVIERELPLEGTVVGGLVVYGKDMTTTGSIEIGTLDPQTGYDATLTVKVNDVEPRLKVTEVFTEPSYIDAQLEPTSDAENTGLYRLRVRIPPTDRAASYMGQRRGKLRLSFDHPRIEQLELGVEFVVMTSMMKRTE